MYVWCYGFVDSVGNVEGCIISVGVSVSSHCDVSMNVVVTRGIFPATSMKVDVLGKVIKENCSFYRSSK